MTQYLGKTAAGNIKSRDCSSCVMLILTVIRHTMTDSINGDSRNTTQFTLLSSYYSSSPLPNF